MNTSVLVLYYSLTGQTQTVIHRISEVLKERGFAVNLQRIQPVDDWSLPFTKLDFARHAFETFAGLPLNCSLEPIKLSPLDYEHVVIGWQPWFLRPSIPVEAFFKSTMGKVVRGRKIWLIGTCRSMWNLAADIMKIRLERLGGTLMGGIMIGGELQSTANLISYGYYMLNGKDVPQNHWARRWEPNWRPFGIGPSGILEAKHYGYYLAESLEAQREKRARTWVRVNF